MGEPCQRVYDAVVCEFHVPFILLAYASLLVNRAST